MFSRFEIARKTQVISPFRFIYELDSFGLPQFQGRRRSRPHFFSSNRNVQFKILVFNEFFPLSSDSGMRKRPTAGTPACLNMFPMTWHKPLSRQLPFQLQGYPMILAFSSKFWWLILADHQSELALLLQCQPCHNCSSQVSWPLEKEGMKMKSTLVWMPLHLKYDPGAIWFTHLLPLATLTSTQLTR